MGVALGFGWDGGAITVSAGFGQPLAGLLGLGIAAVGRYFAAATLGMVPPLREWR